MRFRLRNKAGLLAGAALLVAIPALSQERRPESLLPPGFGDPQTLPPPEKATPRPPRQPETPRQTPDSPPAQTGNGTETVAETENGVESAAEGVDEVAVDSSQLPRPTNYFTVPQGLERSTDLIGPLLPGNMGFAADAFGRTDGFLLRALLRRTSAPLASRWASIVLRRALLSHLPAPAGVQPVDWAAERAAFLVKMGEADAARALVQAVDVEQYTPRMIEAAGETALATADPAALCPLVGPARTMSQDQLWLLADGMCAALEGEAARAGGIIDQVRGRGGANIDLALAEKVVGVGAETRRAAELQWDGVSQITPWRFGLASATGATIPANLIDNAEPRIRAWLARAPMVPIEQRLAAASTAASLGVFSSHSLVEIYSLQLDQTDPAEAAGTVGARLRMAWVEQDPASRLEALRNLWAEVEAPVERQARLILTAGAASRIPVSDDYLADAPNLIASMLSAGMDAEAARWGSVVEAGGASDKAWALLALGAPRLNVAVDGGRIGAFVSADDSPGQKRGPMLVAALAGLGRISMDQASSSGFRPGADDAWTRAIDRAAQAREPGTVALLAGVGLQSSGWQGVPPDYLFRIVRALRTVGMDFEARMIAAEAVARL
ncbi:MAG TPA: hypothetical protein VEC11_04690 [Allosphingosinicella sp.]|nr:hypothetical protein [Allosphingosinicella sp.]